MSTTIPPRLESLLREASCRGASDLFLVPDEPPAMRIGGKVERSEGDVLTAEEVTEIASSVIGEAELRRLGSEVGEIHRPIELPGEVNARFSVARSAGDYTITLMITSLVLPDVKATYMPDAVLQAADSPNGLIIFSGRAGSGKTTSAYSVLDYINARRPGVICTVEDPIMHRMTPKMSIVEQREVGVDVPNILSGIETALRQDADVLFVMEITSLEELQACITAAETGHLVITVLNGATPEDALRRVMDVFPEDIRSASNRALAVVLRAVVAQTLMQRADRPGRVPAYGILIPDDEMRGAIAEGADFLSRRTPLPPGNQTITDEIDRLLREGAITEETARRARERA